MVSELQKDDAPRSQRHRHVDMLPVQARQHAGGEAVSARKARLRSPTQPPRRLKRGKAKSTSRKGAAVPKPGVKVFDSVAEPALASRLRLLSDRMECVGVAMEYYGGFGETAVHGRELMGAAAMARGWAKEMAKKGKP